MRIPIPCSNCELIHRVDPKLLGRKIRCRGCKRGFRLVEEDDTDELELPAAKLPAESFSEGRAPRSARGLVLALGLLLVSTGLAYGASRPSKAERVAAEQAQLLEERLSTLAELGQANSSGWARLGPLSLPAGAPPLTSDLVFVAEAQVLANPEREPTLGFSGPLLRGCRGDAHLTELLLAPRYLAVVRTRTYVAPRLDVAGRSFKSGTWEGEVVLYDLKEREWIGGWPLKATNSGQVSERNFSRGESALSSDLADQVEQALWLRLRTNPKG